MLVAWKISLFCGEGLLDGFGWLGEFIKAFDCRCLILPISCNS